MERHSTLDAGLKLPYPSGHNNNWRAALAALDPDEESTTCAMRACLRDSYRELKDLKRYPEFYGGYKRPINIHANSTHKGAKQKIKAMEALVKDTIKNLPKTLAQAWVGEDADAWREAAELEFNTLTNMGVLDHNYSAKHLLQAGVETTPIPMRVVLDNKYGGEGEFLKHKVRMTVPGHKYNMQKGVHYDDVYAPAPNQNTSRLLSALHVQMHLKRKSFDISLAYCWADLPPGKLIALKCPKGYERKGPDGKDLYMVMRKNCYGHPAASKAWSEHRNGRIQ